MFPRRERLPRAAFPALRGAQRLSGTHMSALVPARAGYAVVISKKTLSRAVDRHRLKRQILAALRALPKGALPPGLVVYPKASAHTLTAAELRSELEGLLRRRT